MIEQERGTGSWIARASLFVLLFFFVLGPRISFLPFPFGDTMLLASVLGASLFAATYLLKPRLPARIASTVSLLALVTVYSCTIVALHGGADPYAAERSLRALVDLLAAIGIASLYRRLYRSDFLLILVGHIFWIGVLHAALIWGMVLSPSVRAFIHSVVEQRLYERGMLDILRPSGLLTQGGDGLSLVQGMFALVGGYLLVRAPGRRAYLYTAAILLVGSSAFLPARTGFFLAAVLALPCLIRVRHELVHLRIPSRSVGKTVLTVGAIGMVVLGVGIVMQEVIGGGLALLWQHYDSPLYRLLEPIRTFGQTGRLATRATDIIFGRMFFLPDSALTFLFGSSNMGRSAVLPYIASDVGYVRILFAVGALGSLLIYGWYSLVWWYGIRLRRITDGVGVLVAWLVLYTALGNLKMVFALSRHGFSIIALLLSGAILMAHSRRESVHGLLSLRTR